MRETPREDVPLLGQAAGAYRERVVPKPLRFHFASIWSREMPPGTVRHTAIVPDACADLVWFNGALLVAGPDRTASFERVAPGTTAVGFRFQPGAASAWLGLPASEIVGERLPLDRFDTGLTHELLDSIGDARGPEEVATQLAKILCRSVLHRPEPDGSSKTIVECLANRRATNSPTTKELASALGISERTLRRLCEHAFGYGPKTLDRILRIQRFLSLAGKQDVPGLAELAAAAGYSDQAHLTRETRDMTGLTPKTILDQLAPRDHGNRLV